MIRMPVKGDLVSLTWTLGKPLILIGHTVKGKIVKFLGKKVEWHYRTPNVEELAQAFVELEGASRDAYAFIGEQVAHADMHPNFALLVGDLGYSVVELFADPFPERCINAGVAEQDMMGLAAGMASEGYHIFVYSINNFTTFRAPSSCATMSTTTSCPSRSSRSAVVWPMAPWTTRSTPSTGLRPDAQPDQHAHCHPCDPMEVRTCMRYLIRYPRPSYLRLAKAGEPCFHLVETNWLDNNISE